MNTRLQDYLAPRLHEDPVSYKKTAWDLFKRVVHIRFAKVNPARQAPTESYNE